MAKLKVEEQEASFKKNKKIGDFGSLEMKSYESK